MSWLFLSESEPCVCVHLSYLVCLFVCFWIRTTRPLSVYTCYVFCVCFWIRTATHQSVICLTCFSMRSKCSRCAYSHYAFLASDSESISLGVKTLAIHWLCLWITATARSAYTYSVLFASESDPQTTLVTHSTCSSKFRRPVWRRPRQLSVQFVLWHMQ